VHLKDLRFFLSNRYRINAGILKIKTKSDNNPGNFILFCAASALTHIEILSHIRKAARIIRLLINNEFKSN
jgi:hypothetical protein